jgi:hypothetical protein
MFWFSPNQHNINETDKQGQVMLIKTQLLVGLPSYAVERNIEQTYDQVEEAIHAIMRTTYVITG